METLHYLGLKELTEENIARFEVPWTIGTPTAGLEWRKARPLAAPSAIFNLNGQSILTSLIPV